MKDTFNRLVPGLPWAGLVLIIVGLALTLAGGSQIIINLLIGGGAVLLLLFAVIRPHDVRELLAGRTTRYGLSTVLSIVFFTAIAAVLYWMAAENESWRFDFTAEQQFTPIPEVVNLLEETEADIDVLAFMRSSSMLRSNARQYLENLAAADSNLEFEFHDPDTELVLAERYGVTADGTYIFVVNRGTADERVIDIYNLDDRSVYSALLQIVNPNTKRAYYITGHGEPDLGGSSDFDLSTARGYLEDLNFEVETIDLRTTGTIPDDADVLMLIAPRREMQAAEIDLIAAYLENGGALFVARDVAVREEQQAAEQDDLQPYLTQNWGITFRPDVIVDPEQVRFNQSLAFIARNFGSSIIVAGDVPELGLGFDTARSLLLENVTGVELQPLVRSSDEAWGETDLENPPSPTPNEDAAGPLYVAASGENVTTNGRLVAVGDANFIINRDINIGANSLFLTNAMNWLAQDDLTLNLTPRETIDRQLTVSTEQITRLQIAAACTGPIIILLAGGGMFFYRRRRKA